MHRAIAPRHNVDVLTWLIKGRVERVFRDIGRRELAKVIAGLAPDVHHRFAGDHALAGERHTRDDVERWFQRVFRLYPELTFTVHGVHASGWPWDLVVAVEWTGHAVPAVGDAYDNHGAHVIRIQRGRVTQLHAYEDSQAVARACEVMAAAGIEEASASPIES